MEWPDESVLSWFPESARPEIQALMEAAHIAASDGKQTYLVFDRLLVDKLAYAKYEP